MNIKTKYRLEILKDIFLYLIIFLLGNLSGKYL